MPIRLNHKDFLLLRYLFEHDWVSIDVIKDYIWNGLTSRDYVRKRLWQLNGGKGGEENQKWIRRFTHEYLSLNICQASRFAERMIKNNRSFYNKIIQAKRRRLGNSNKDEIDMAEHPRKFYRHSKRKHVNPISFDHDHALLQLRMVLEDTGQFYNYIPEKMIKSEVFSSKGNNLGVIPDALVFRDWRENSDQIDKYAIELEYTRKSKGSYIDKLRKYINGGIFEEIDLLFCLYTNRSTLRSLVRAIKFLDQSQSNSDDISISNSKLMAYRGEVKIRFANYSDLINVIDQEGEVKTFEGYAGAADRVGVDI